MLILTLMCRLRLCASSPLFLSASRSSFLLLSLHEFILGVPGRILKRCFCAVYGDAAEALGFLEDGLFVCMVAHVQLRNCYVCAYTSSHPLTLACAPKTQIVVMSARGTVDIPAISVSGNVLMELQMGGPSITIVPGPELELDGVGFARLFLDFSVFLVAFCVATLMIALLLYVQMSPFWYLVPRNAAVVRAHFAANFRSRTHMCTPCKTESAEMRTRATPARARTHTNVHVFFSRPHYS